MPSKQKIFPLTSLSEEVLLHVFKFLTVNERKEASLVCKLWNELLALPRFTKDCPLKYQTWAHFMGDSKSTEPLMKSVRKFHHLVIETVPFVQTMPEEELPLFAKIGPGVRYLTINGFLVGFQRFLKYFVNLKEIKVDGLLLYAIALGIPPSVKRIHVQCFRNKTPPDMLQTLNMWKNEGKFLSCEFVILQDPYHPDAPNGCPDYAKVDNVVQEMLNNHKLVAISCLPNINLFEVAEFGLKDLTRAQFNKNELTKYKEALTKCSNLIILVLIVGSDSCFFYHEKVNLSNVECIDLRVEANGDPGKRTACVVCLKWLNINCPKISSWNITAQIENFPDIVNSTVAPVKYLHIFSVQENLNFNLNFPQLISLMIDTDYSKPYTQDNEWLASSENWPDMPHLRALFLGPTIVCTDENMKTFIEKTPNVKYVEFVHGPSNQKVSPSTKGWRHLKEYSSRWHNPS